MRELRERLEALGLTTTDPPGAYAKGTTALVEAFQRSRGLPITGEVDDVTWTRLVEAGWRLGQRLLYLSRPNLRGDDVADLQIHLAQLGFNPGRIDGIFGPLLEHALSDFQRNRDLPVDGTLTRATLLELRRLSGVVPERHLVNEARDVAGFDEPATGPLVVCGATPLAALVAEAASPAFVVQLLEGGAEESAAYANEVDAALVLSFASSEVLHSIHVHYWASYHSHSHRGDWLAGEVASGLARSSALPRVEVTGMALPILRETRMTTLHIEHGPVAPDVLGTIAAEIMSVIVRVFHRHA